MKAYAKTQATCAQSSAESELFAIVRASCEALGMQTLLGDFGYCDVDVQVHVDATATKSIVERRG